MASGARLSAQGEGLFSILNAPISIDQCSFGMRNAKLQSIALKAQNEMSIRRSRRANGLHRRLSSPSIFWLS